MILTFFVHSYQLWSPEPALSSADGFIVSYFQEAIILFTLLIYKMQKADVEGEHSKRLSYAKAAMAIALQSEICWIFKPRWGGYSDLALMTKDIFWYIWQNYRN